MSPSWSVTDTGICYQWYHHSHHWHPCRKVALRMCYPDTTFTLWYHTATRLQTRICHYTCKHVFSAVFILQGGLLEGNGERGMGRGGRLGEGRRGSPSGPVLIPRLRGCWSLQLWVWIPRCKLYNCSVCHSLLSVSNRTYPKGEIGCIYVARIIRLNYINFERLNSSNYTFAICNLQLEHKSDDGILLAMHMIMAI